MLLTAVDHVTDSISPTEAVHVDFAPADRLASLLLVECAYPEIALCAELQNLRRTPLEHGEAHREGVEQRGLSAAILGEEDRGIFLDRKPQLFEATVVVDADLAKPESAHVTLRGGPSGESYGMPFAAAAASAS